MDEHEEDNWCSEECLQENWSYGGKKPAMSYGVKKATLLGSGRSEVGSSPPESRTGPIMASDGRYSDDSRLQGDLRSMSAWHLTVEDVQKTRQGGEEEEYDSDAGEALNSCSSEGKLTTPLLTHQISENSPPKKKRHSVSSSIYLLINKRPW